MLHTELLKVENGVVYKLTEKKDTEGNILKKDGVIQYKKTKVASLNDTKNGFESNGIHYDITKATASGIIGVVVVGQPEPTKE